MLDPIVAPARQPSRRIFRLELEAPSTESVPPGETVPWTRLAAEAGSELARDAAAAVAVQSSGLTASSWSLLAFE